MDVSAVIFDMDGVIVDSEQYWHDVQQQLLDEAMGTDAVTPDDLTGMNVNDQYAHLSDEYSVTVSADEWFALYDDHAETVYTEHVDLMDGFRHILDTLRDKDIRIAVASSSFRHWIGMVLDRFDLVDAFDAVVSAEDIDGESKPEPDIYLHTADALDVAPENCVVVEDSAHGVAAAKAAGMYCIGFRTDHNHGQDLSRADTVVNGADGLQRFVADL